MDNPYKGTTRYEWKLWKMRGSDERISKLLTTGKSYGKASKMETI